MGVCVCVYLQCAASDGLNAEDSFQVCLHVAWKYILTNKDSSSSIFLNCMVFVPFLLSLLDNLCQITFNHKVAQMRNRCDFCR